MDALGQKAQGIGIAALALTALLSGALQLAPVYTATPTGIPGAGVGEGAWAFDTGGSPHMWLDPSFDGAPNMLLLRAAGPAMAVACAGFLVALVAVWRRAHRLAAWTTLGSTALLLAAAAMDIYAIQDFNRNQPVSISTDAAIGLFLGPVAVAAGVVAWLMLRKAAKRAGLEAATEPGQPAGTKTSAALDVPAGTWTPPPGYDSQTGLYVGQRR